MKKEIENEMDDELRREHDFAQMQVGVRGKYSDRYQAVINRPLSSFRPPTTTHA
jgi:hypothetical protein